MVGQYPRHLRCIGAKERYMQLFPITEAKSPQHWPAVFLVVAESLFWLGDLGISQQLLLRLAEVLEDDAQLQCLLRHFDEILTEEAKADEAYHQTVGEVSTFLFVTPVGCPGDLISMERLLNVKTKWTNMCSQEASATEEYVRLVCISTNDLEGVFRIEEHSWPRLIRQGFYANSIDRISLHSRVKNKRQILRILDNTRQCLTQISSILDDPTRFTPEFIKGLHRTQLLNDNFEEEQMEDGFNVIRVIRAGAFREVACLTFHNNGKDVVQFCHHSDIAQEMERYCEGARRIMCDETVDPFVKAAWMQWAFCRIHPFEDGNGRISRILASVPLCKHDLPPIVVTSKYKSDYFAALHLADRESDLTLLASFLYQSMDRGTTYLESLPAATALPSRLSVPRLRRSSTESSSSSRQYCT